MLEYSMFLEGQSVRIKHADGWLLLVIGYIFASMRHIVYIMSGIWQAKPRLFPFWNLEIIAFLLSHFWKVAQTTDIVENFSFSIFSNFCLLLLLPCRVIRTIGIKLFYI